MTKVAIIYYSATGSMHRIALAIAGGATEAGAEVRIRQVPEIAADEAIAANAKWSAHRDATSDVPLATLDDLEWADGVVWGSPTRFGNVAYQLKAFMDQTGSLWARGKLANKAMAGFTGASTRHGGLETTLLAMYNSFYSWGAIIVPPGYVDAVQFKAGNPYGISHVGSGPLEPEVEAAARYQGRRIAEIAAKLAG